MWLHLGFKFRCIGYKCGMQIVCLDSLEIWTTFKVDNINPSQPHLPFKCVSNALQCYSHSWQGSDLDLSNWMLSLYSLSGFQEHKEFLLAPWHIFLFLKQWAYFLFLKLKNHFSGDRSLIFDGPKNTHSHFYAQIIPHICHLQCRCQNFQAGVKKFPK